LDTVEKIIGEKIEIPGKLQEFMKGEKQIISLKNDFESFKNFLLSAALENKD
jgi:threonine synthase